MGAAKVFDFPQSGKDQTVEARANQSTVARATVFISRVTVRSVMMRELKNYGIGELKFADSVEECAEDMQANPNSMLVIDWEFGEQKVTRALRAAQGTYRLDTRPIYFLALDVSDRVIAVAGEYNVAQIHTGEISQAQIIKNLDELLVFSLTTPLCQDTFRKVCALRKDGDWKASALMMHELCDAEPRNLRAAVEYGFDLCEAGRVDAAEKWLRDVCKRFPEDLRAKHLLARCAMKKGKFSEAKKLLKEASLISPHNVERLVDLGRVLLGLDQVDEALGQFTEALKLDSDFSEAKVGKAQCDLLRGHVNEAMKLLSQLETPQETASVFNSAAILAVRHQHYKQGFSLYKTACGFLRSDSHLLARVFFNMGVGLLKWGKIEAAIQAFQRAIVLDPSLTKAQHNIGILSGNAPRGEKASSHRIEEMESLDQDYSVKSSSEEASMDGDSGSDDEPEPSVEDVDDTYFQSLIAST